MSLQEFDELFEGDEDDSSAGSIMGRIGGGALHLCHVCFLIYSGYHGIHASSGYAANTEFAKAAQIFGILVIEISLLGIAMAVINGKIIGVRQMMAAGVTYALGFLFALMGILADSQLNAIAGEVASATAAAAAILAEAQAAASAVTDSAAAAILAEAQAAASALTGQRFGELSNILSIYLKWGLPIAPAAMALGGFAVHIFEPARLRRFEELKQEQSVTKLKFEGRMIAARFDLQEQAAKAGFGIASRRAVIEEVMNYHKTPEFRQLVQDNVKRDIPLLLAAAGLKVNGRSSQVIEMEDGDEPVPTHYDAPVPASPHISAANGVGGPEPLVIRPLAGSDGVSALNGKGTDPKV